MKKHLILIKSSSDEQFHNLYAAVESGYIVLPGFEPLPEESEIILKLVGTRFHPSILITGKVSSSHMNQGDASGLVVDIVAGMQSVLSKMDLLMVPVEQFRDLPHPEDSQREASNRTPVKSPVKEKKILPDKEPGQKEKIVKKSTPVADKTGGGHLSFEEIKEIVSVEEVEIEFDKEEEITTKAVAEKKELSPEERQMAEPVAKFIMNLTKAMSRSGYYDPNHPSSKMAKKGFYDEFIRVAGDHHEISFINRKTGEEVDIFISGILDSHVNVRTLVGAGLAGLFVPKLSEYCDRKQLLSFAIKKEITPEHFDRFLDIMSDPSVDQQEIREKGAYLTKVLIENNITEISTVFVDDMLNFEMDLPWRVQMAMHRLAKDLKVMPMFKNVSSDAINTLKFQTIQDIIRPLNHPKYFNDFLVNCYIIVKNVEDMKPEDIEHIIVNAFPLKLLLPTSQYTFKELANLQELKAEQPDNASVNQRLFGIRRILKLIASRVVVEKAPGAANFLEHLYRNNILSFRELPVEAQYLVNTRNLADDIVAGLDQYKHSLLQVHSSEEAFVYLKCFRRTVPIFIEEGKWEEILQISKIVHDESLIDVLSPDWQMSGLKILKQEIAANAEDVKYFESLNGSDISEQLQAYIFKDVINQLASVYETIDKSSHPLLEEIISNLGALGVDMLSRLLAKSKDKDIRRFCIESLIKKGELTRKWALDVLGNEEMAWYIHRNAMMILRGVSKKAEDFERVRRYSNHSNSKIREEVINLITHLRPHDAVSLVIQGLDDVDVKVRWRSTRALNDISPISEQSFKGILDIIKTPVPEDKDLASDHMKKMMNLISAINGLPEIPNIFGVESVILDVLNSMMGHEKGFFKLLKRVIGSEEEMGVLKAAVPLLGRIGGSSSEPFLKKLAKTHSQLSDLVQKSLEKIHQRIA